MMGRGAVFVWAAALAVAAGMADRAVAVPGSSVEFRRTVLDRRFRSEGVAVGDFNGDGQLDIAAGNVYFAAPDWKMVPLEVKPREFDPLQYSDSFGNFAEDVNGDGRTDLVIIDFPGKQTWWLEQPAKVGDNWTRHEATPSTCNEAPMLVDLDGDRHRELVFGFEPGKHVGFAKPASSGPWQLTPVSEPNAPGSGQFSHGLGVGDINGDGRLDVLIKEGWWEAPADRDQRPWTFHPVNFGGDCAQMHVYDVDGDGDSDVFSSSAHGSGIWWHEQTPDGWTTHEIDRGISQTHALCMADINDDGLPDLITGKRWWAHGPTGDEAPNAPAVMRWYELSRSGGKPQWTAHQFDDDSGIGTQFEITDVNGDGLLDVVTANKKGVHYFEQVRK